MARCADADESHQGEIVDTDEQAEAEPQEERQPVLIDTTAELLGRVGEAKAQYVGGTIAAARASGCSAARAAAKKLAAKRPSRAKSAASNDDSQD
jgi:hypothetical protein